MLFHWLSLQLTSYHIQYLYIQLTARFRLLHFYSTHNCHLVLQNLSRTKGHKGVGPYSGSNAACMFTLTLMPRGKLQYFFTVGGGQNLSWPSRKKSNPELLAMRQLFLPWCRGVERGWLSCTETENRLMVQTTVKGENAVPAWFTFCIFLWKLKLMFES